MPEKEEREETEEKAGHPLEDAPEHVQLAVDLIMLFESNNINTDTAIKALEIVQNDLIYKQKKAQP
ncbi:YbaM family protein [Psychrosphaera haliotis]|uniref:YbaM family protein n=1 Tax=Psychrosphaera haliotis TaxID=555083 RepID=UPI00236A4F65|nr:YbaM family protein [Psychrosphaera haliotis]